MSTWAVTLVPSRVLKAPTIRRRTCDRLRNALRPAAVTTTSAAGINRPLFDEAAVEQVLKRTAEARQDAAEASTALRIALRGQEELD